MNFNTERLRALLGSEEAALRFMGIFQEQLPEQTAALRQAFAQGDWEAVSNVSHALKSQCRYLGLDTMADHLQLLENDPQNKAAEAWLNAVLEGLPDEWQ